jgi:TrmH family RNA methyltransferase
MTPPLDSTRRRIVGPEAIARALDAGAAVQCLVVPEGELAAEIEALCARAAAVGAEIVRTGARRQTRLAGEADAVALVGPSRDADLDTVMARGGAAWLLVGAAYPGNIGTAIRTAEGSGADGVYIDNDFDHAKRREARRASMRTDRYLPVAWEAAGTVIGAARRAGKKIVGIEDCGDCAPWETTLAGPTLFVAGGESDGIPPTLLRRCDAVVRIPMAGFVTSYNLQAAVAVLAAERLRQRGTTAS